MAISDIFKLITTKKEKSMDPVKKEESMNPVKKEESMDPVSSTYNDFDGHDTAEQYVVLMKEQHSRTWKPIFHTKELRKTPARKLVNNVASGPEIWDSNAGAVEFINYHSAGASPGTQYTIKNRKGEVV